MPREEGKGALPCNTCFTSVVFSLAFFTSPANVIASEEEAEFREAFPVNSGWPSRVFPRRCIHACRRGRCESVGRAIQFSKQELVGFPYAVFFRED